MERYPLVSALSRPLIAKHLVVAAREHGADTVAHGCTGKGNDQVRFEVGIGALDPDLLVLAPVRDSGMTRDKAIAFAEQKGLPIDQSKRSPYSIDQNLWGRAVETGFLEDPWNAPTKELYAYTAPPAESTGDEVVISFTDGVPTAIDGRGVSVLDAILELNRRAGAQGVGRLDMVEDRLVGIKSREVYEAPGAIALITAHRELEDLTVERDLGGSSSRSSSGGPSWSTTGCGSARSSGRSTRSSTPHRCMSPERSGCVCSRCRGCHRTPRSRLAVRLRPGHLRHRRHVRPVAGQGLRAAVGTAQPDRCPPGPRLVRVERHLVERA